MERKNEIRISIETINLSQIFIHTAGAYMTRPISKNNNKYIANLGNVPEDKRFGLLVLALENASSKEEQEKIINELKSIIEIDKSVKAEPLSFNHNIENLNGYIVFEPTTSIENYDLNILDFISYDFNIFNDYLLFFINFFDYFIDKLDSKDINKIELDTLYPVSEIVEIAKKYYEKEKQNLIYHQSIFKKCIDFIYCINNPLEKEMEDLTAKQKFFLYSSLYPNTFKDFSQDFHTTNLLEYNYNNFPIKKEDIMLADASTLISTIKDFDPSGRHISNLHQFVTTNLFTAFYTTLFYLVSINKLQIKLCGNCNRYFLTPKKNVTYCDRITENNMTCKDIGNKEYQKRKKENDITYDKYRKIGSRKQLRVSRNPEIDMYKKDLEQFRTIGTKMYKQFCNGQISHEDFAKWVDEQDK